MRTLISAFSILLGLVAVAGAQSRRGGGTNSDTAVIRRTIVDIEERIGRANLTCDYSLFSAVEAPEFIFTDARGGVTTRAEDLAGASSCHPRRGTFVLDEIRMQFHGNVVVFNARGTTTSERDTLPPAASRNRFTDVLVRRDTSWVLVAGHASRLP